MNMMWPEIFTTEDVSGKSKSELCADGLCAWGNCCAGSKPPESFGRVLVKIGQKLDISPTGDELMKWAKKNVK